MTGSDVSGRRRLARWSAVVTALLLLAAIGCWCQSSAAAETLLSAAKAAPTEVAAGPAEQGCLSSGGTVSSAMCCGSARDFPNTCLIGPCGCGPDSSHRVRICDCGPGRCFDGKGCVKQ